MNKKVVFLPYDYDTAIGTDNVGALTYSYNLEDTDTVNGNHVYNGHGSTLWNNIRDAFPTELRTMYQQLRSNDKLSYDIVETMFEEHQGKWSEAIFNDDGQVKYIDAITEDNDASYLPMLQGNKAEQRKWWLFNRFKYIDSKYNAGDALTSYINMRIHAQANITVTSYTDIYATAKFGAYYARQKATRNTPITLVCPVNPDSNGTETQVFSASQLLEIGDLSPLQLGLANFSAATKLKKIKVGDGDSNYSNTYMTDFTVGNNRLLEEVDVRNCPNLSGSMDLSNCVQIENVYASGTTLQNISLPVGGVLKKLYLPGTITNLTIRGHAGITHFSCPDYTNITTLWLDGVSSVVPVEDIIDDMATGSRVRLYNFDWTVNDLDDVAGLFTKLRSMKGVDQNGNETPTAQVYGTIHTGSTTGAKVAQITNYFPNVTIDYEHVISYTYFYNYDGSELLSTAERVDGAAPTAYTVPARAQDAQYTYTPVGWSLSTNAQTADAAATAGGAADIVCYAAYSRIVRTYTITFKTGSEDGNTVLATYHVAYGSTPVYSGSTPTTTREYYVFNNAWHPAIVPVTEATTYYAVFKDTRSVIVMYLADTLVNYESALLTTIPGKRFQNMLNLETFKAPITSTANESCFVNCVKLYNIDLSDETNSVTIGSLAFTHVTKHESLFIRSNQVATLTNINAFNEAAIKAGPLAIYVPDALVSNYKAATNWSSYASRIYPISRYPVTDFSTISDSWSQIIAHAANGTHSTVYNKGDIKKLSIVNHNNLDYFYMQYVGDRPEGPIWLSQTVVDSFTMHNNINNSSLVYDGSNVDVMLNTTWLNDYLPEELQNAIASVPITYYNGIEDKTLTINRKLWVPSTKELGFTGASCKEDSGYVFDISPGAKYRRNTDIYTVATYWTRSHYASYDASTANRDTVKYCTRSTSTTPASAKASASNYIALGFVLSGPSNQ